MPTARNTILERIKDAPDKAWTPSDFTDLATRQTVDKVLQRLTKEGELRRIDRGMYDRPTVNQLTGKKNVPDPKAVIDAIARRDRLRILVDGLTAANDLGLTNAVPAKIIARTERRLKPVQLGNLEIEFKPTTTSKLFWAGRPAMRLVQALHWLRDILSRPTDRDLIEKKIERILADDDGEVLRSDLEEGWASLPIWLQEFLRPILDTKNQS